VKFRCERDVLVEALGTAGRAAAGRGTSLPVLSGVRVQLTGDQLRLTGTDLELTIAVEVTVSGSGDGVVILPGRLASDIVRAPGGSVEVEVTEDEARISRWSVEFSRILPADEFCGSPGDRRVRHPRQRQAATVVPGGAGGLGDDAADPHRVLLRPRLRPQARRHRLLPAGHPRSPPPVFAEGQRPGAPPALQELLRSCAAIFGSWAARGGLEVGGAKFRHGPHRGEFRRTSG
jgi:hypothetical protein